MRSTLEMPRRHHHQHHHNSHSLKHVPSSRKSSRTSGAIPSANTSGRRPVAVPEGRFNPLRFFWGRCVASLLNLCRKGNKIQEQHHQQREGSVSNSNQGSLASESSFIKIRVCTIIFPVCHLIALNTIWIVWFWGILFQSYIIDQGKKASNDTTNTSSIYPNSCINFSKRNESHVCFEVSKWSSQHWSTGKKLVNKLGKN